MVRDLCKMEREKGAGMIEVESLVGILNYYAALVPGGKRNRSMIGNVVRRSTGRDDNRWMPFDRAILRQVKWWRISLGAVHEGGTKIQDPGRKFLYPVDPVLVFSDATRVEEASSTFKGMGVWEGRSGKCLLSKWPGLVMGKFSKQYPFWRGWQVWWAC